MRATTAHRNPLTLVVCLFSSTRERVSAAYKHDKDKGLDLGVICESDRFVFQCVVIASTTLPANMSSREQNEGRGERMNRNAM